MKSEPKAFASLSSGLLARKGAARPAMRPQGFTQTGSSPEDLGWNDMGFEPPKPAATPVRDADHDAFGEQLPEAPPRHSFAGLTPVDSPVHNQQAQIAGRLSVDTPDEEEDEEEGEETAELYVVAPEPVADAAPAEADPQPVTVAPAPVEAPQRRPAPFSQATVGKAKAAFTLRLDPDRHLKLRLACAVSGRSAQALVTHAVDQLLLSMPELDSMAQKAKHKG